MHTAITGPSVTKTKTKTSLENISKCAVLRSSAYFYKKKEAQWMALRLAPRGNQCCGSGIWCIFYPLVPGGEKPGSGMKIPHILPTLVTIFRVKKKLYSLMRIRDLFQSGSGIRNETNLDLRDKHPGSATLEVFHRYWSGHKDVRCAVVKGWTWTSALCGYPKGAINFYVNTIFLYFHLDVCSSSASISSSRGVGRLPALFTFFFLLPLSTSENKSMSARNG